MESRRARLIFTLRGKQFASRNRLARALLPLLAFVATSVLAIDVSDADAARIGRRIWQNECNGTVAGLTSWNEGEEFASLGIGHFIWYPEAMRGPFEESFPAFVDYARRRGLKLPDLLLKNRACPWRSRAEFQKAQQSAEMNGLRAFLADTVDLQAKFMVQRLEAALPKMLDEASPDERANIRRQFDRVASTSHGCYALIDYVNFKGEGVLATERYNGDGWGLLQVLAGMRGSGDGPAAADEFADSAKAVLTRRVRNSPPARKESRWLAGWLKRVSTYRAS